MSRRMAFRRAGGLVQALTRDTPQFQGLVSARGLTTAPLRSPLLGLPRNMLRASAAALLATQVRSVRRYVAVERSTCAVGAVLLPN